MVVSWFANLLSPPLEAAGRAYVGPGHEVIGLAVMARNKTKVLNTLRGVRRGRRPSFAICQAQLAHLRDEASGGTKTVFRG